MTAAVWRAVPESVRLRLAGWKNAEGILKNVGWLFADRILRMGLGLLLGAWVARYLGSEQFGLFSYATAFVTIFGTLSSIGIDSIVIRDLVRDPECKNETLGTAFAIRVGGSVATFLLAITAIFLLRSDSLTRSAVAIVAAGGFFLAFDTIDFWFQSQVQSKFTVYAKNGAFLISAFVKLSFLLSHASLTAFLILTVVENALGAAGLVLFYHNRSQHFRQWRLSLDRAKQLISHGWPLMLSSLMIMLYMRVDQIMLGQMMGDREVGIYSAAVKISELWYFIPVALVSSLFPAIITARKVDPVLYSKRMQHLLTGMALLGYAVAIPATFLSDFVVHLIFGTQFEGAAPSLVVLFWAGLFVAMGVARESWLVTEGLTKISLANTALGAAINVGLNLVLIPRVGPLGAAIATLVSYGTAAFAAGFVSSKTRPVATMMLNAILLKPLYVRAHA